ncbi:unnamed protein product [Chrysoparadoxa australica]
MPSSHTPTRCLYEALGIEDRSASEAVLKSAYRKLALKHHPDKNVGDENAVALFQEIQHAYSVLSDPNERRWYDEHRDDILRDDDNDSGKGGEINLYHYFNASAYTGFGDDEHGFTAVYSQAFDRVFDGEADAWDSTAPPFGSSTSPYKEVARFYAFWGGFVSRLSFAWADEYNFNEAGNRRIRRLMEKENAKLRAEAKKKYNAEIRALVDFCKRRDPRVKQEKARVVLEKERKETERQAKAKSKAEENKRRREEWAAERELEAARRQDEDDDEDEDVVRLADEHQAEADAKAVREEQDVIYRCAVCKKDFKSQKQMLNHEQSKAHRKKMDQFEAEIQEYEEEVDVQAGGVAGIHLIDESKSEVEDGEESEGTEVSVGGSIKLSGEVVESDVASEDSDGDHSKDSDSDSDSSDSDSDSDDGADFFNRFSAVKKEHWESDESEEDDGCEDEDAIAAAAAAAEIAELSSSDENAVATADADLPKEAHNEEANGDEDEEEEEEFVIVGADACANAKKGKKQKRVIKGDISGEVKELGGSNTCRICGETFSSRTKM